MSGDRPLRVSLTAMLLATFGPLLAADEELPEMEFLEYLGMWEESDEEWLALEEPLAKTDDERKERKPDGEESTEKDDES